MSSDDELLLRDDRRSTFLWPTHRRSTTSFGWKLRLKRRKLPAIRLGKRRGAFFIRVFRRFRIRRLRFRASNLLNKLRAFYSKLISDLIEASAAMDAVQSRMMMETYFVAPIMPLSLTGLTPASHSDPVYPSPSGALACRNY